jgi:hypothetical protein
MRFCLCFFGKKFLLYTASTSLTHKSAGHEGTSNAGIAKVSSAGSRQEKITRLRRAIFS